MFELEFIVQLVTNQVSRWNLLKVQIFGVSERMYIYFQGPFGAPHPKEIFWKIHPAPTPVCFLIIYF